MRARQGDVSVALRAAGRGDPDALATLWRAFQPLLLRYLRGRGLDDAEGVTSQIWIDAARNLADFHGGEDEFRRWLFTIAHRRVIDHRRRTGRLAPTRPLDPDQVTTAVTAPSADAAYDEQTALQRALELVASLPDAMREAVLLRIVVDLPVTDVSDVMGVSPGNVRVLVHRGLRRLEQQLAGSDRTLVPIL